MKISFRGKKGWRNFENIVNAKGNYRINQDGYNEISLWQGDSLLEILDEDGFVIIGDYLFFLDFNNRIVVVSSDFELKNSIMEGVFSSNNIRLFSFDDDVIGLIEVNSPSTIAKSLYNSRIASVYNPSAVTVAGGCGWDKCDNSQNYGDISGLGYSGGNFRYRLDAKHVYAAAGISFKLFSKAKHMRKPDDGSLFWTAEATTQYLWFDYEFLSKKNGSSLQKQSGERSQFINDFEVRYYSSSRGLERFYLKTQFYAEAGGNHGYSPIGTFWQFNLRQIDKGY